MGVMYLLDIEKKITELFTGKECLELVCEIIDAAHHGAWTSSDVVEGKFARFKLLKAKTLEYIEEHKDAAFEIMKAKLRYSHSFTRENFKSSYLTETKQVQEKVKEELED
ncbi:hypothetical protein J8M21_11320 [Pseudoalteromonas luteoviolacea]|uniref:hypothetical protein n=1 Tax=Pseudoalteromonas luteoviolacea TaxID=43657 RepID=UPI001B39DC06|nr:hypothetical protein [Pseudoalteromonas luteoviolacea]MBQ4877797.1 hypothetical protein [Pseudoalteromonas luteoviolacea]MBQ4906757.1 hypothetical protein [Pseudoalteromonas luteoviolacea]